MLTIVTLLALILSFFLGFSLVLLVFYRRCNGQLRGAIARHRDARGNDRCWLDDEELYRYLGDDHQALTVLPPKAVFLENCSRFHENRQHPYHLSLFRDVHPGGATPERPCQK